MNNLSAFYDTIKGFCDDHNMVNQFLLLGSERDLEGKEFDYRTFVMIPSRSNISRDLARPIYSLTFDCVILDKCKSEDPLASINSTEENIFVVGQLQDFLTQEGENCYVEDVEVENYITEDTNVTSVYFELTVAFARKNYNAGIDA